MTQYEIEEMVARWLNPDAEIDREIDAVLGLTERRARAKKLTAMLNRQHGHGGVA